MNREPQATKPLTEVLSGGDMTDKSALLGDDLTTRMEDGASGIASKELGDAGPVEDDDRLEALPGDLRPDHLEREELDPERDLDPTSAELLPDLTHLEGDFRGVGDANLHGLTDSGERAAPVADEKAYRPEGDLTAAPTRKS